MVIQNFMVSSIDCIDNRKKSFHSHENPVIVLAKLWIKLLTNKYSCIRIPTTICINYPTFRSHSTANKKDVCFTFRHNRVLRDLYDKLHNLFAVHYL